MSVAGGPDPAPASAYAATAAAAPEAGDLQARLEALLPRQLLQPTETVRFIAKPSVWFIVLVPLEFLVGVGALGFAGYELDQWLNDGALARTILIATFALLALRLTWQFLDWLTRVYVLTDQRVIRVKGVLNVTVFEARLSHIQHTDLLLPLRQRLFGLGTVTFSTAGSGTIEAAWVYLNQPLDAHEAVVTAIRGGGGTS